MVASRQYAEPGQRVLASAPDAQMPLWGLTISHPLFVGGNGIGVDGEQEHWIINRPVAMTLTLEDSSEQEYLPAYFEIVLPNMDGKGQSDVQLTLQNVDRVIVDELEAANVMRAMTLVQSVQRQITLGASVPISHQSLASRP